MLQLIPFEPKKFQGDWHCLICSPSLCSNRISQSICHQLSFSVNNQNRKKRIASDKYSSSFHLSEKKFQGDWHCLISSRSFCPNRISQSVCFDFSFSVNNQNRKKRIASDKCSSLFQLSEKKVLGRLALSDLFSLLLALICLANAINVSLADTLSLFRGFFIKLFAPVNQYEVQ